MPVLILRTCEFTEYLQSLKGMFMVGYSGAYGRVHSRILSINDLSSLEYAINIGCTYFLENYTISCPLQLDSLMLVQTSFVSGFFL